MSKDFYFLKRAFKAAFTQFFLFSQLVWSDFIAAGVLKQQITELQRDETRSSLTGRAKMKPRLKFQLPEQYLGPSGLYSKLTIS